MLLRSMQRQREVAVRLALGSAWRHVVRMLLAETSLICGAALALGVALTAFLLGTLAPLVETQLGRPAPAASGITLDTTVLAMVGAVSLLVAVALSLAPLTAWGRGLTNALRQDARVATEGRSMRRVRSALIAFELAGSLVLLVGCGLMIRSVVQMMDVDLGFEPRGLSASRIMLRARHYPDAAAYRRFHERFAGELSTTAGGAGRVQHLAAFRAAAGACHRAGRRTRDRTGRIDRRQRGVLRGVRHSAPAGPRLHARGSVDGCGGRRDQRVAGPAAVARRQRARPARPQRRAHAGRIDAGAVAHHHRHRRRRAAGVRRRRSGGFLHPENTRWPLRHVLHPERSAGGARSSTICDASRRVSIATR